MIPVHLRISGFLSYRHSIELDFSSFELACISGANGAGKSSLLDAITWALFGQARKRDDSLINAQSDSAEVVFTFAYEKNVYRLRRASPRGKTSLLEFHILQRGDHSVAADHLSLKDLEGNWKPLTERTLRDTQGLIESTLRMDYETFVNASFFLQGKADQFTQQKASDRKRILGSILGLEIWEEYRQQAAEIRRGVEEQIASLDARLEEIHRELAEESQRKARLKELESQLELLVSSRALQEANLERVAQIAATLAEQRKLVNTLRRQMDASLAQLSELEKRMAQRQDEKAKFTGLIERSAEIEAAFKAWQQARTDLEYWNEIAAQFQEQQKRRQPLLDEINAERARLSQERQSLSAQKEAQETQAARLPGIQSQVKQIQDDVFAAESRLSRRSKLEEQLQLARQEVAEAKVENPRLKAEMDELKERIDQLGEVEGVDCPLCGQPLSPEDRLRLMEELANQGRQLGDRFRANQALLKDAEQNTRDLEDQIRQLSQSEAELRTLTQNHAQLDAQISQIEQQNAAWQAEGALRLSQVSEALEKESFSLHARELLAEVDAELRKIGYDATAHDAARRAESVGRPADQEQRALEKAQTALVSLERELMDLKKQVEALSGEAARQQEEHDQAAARLAAAEVEAPDLDAARRELFDLQEQEQRLRMEVGAAQQRVLVLTEQKKRSKTIEAQREELARAAGQYKQLERAFGKDGVPALLIEQALPEIETRANEVLERLSDGSMSVRFVTQAAYKDKRREDLKETLDIQISDGAGTRDYEMFSGGEAFRVNFAIRLALSEVLAQRAGARLQTLVIDEGFGSQDAQGRQRLIEAINLVQQDFAKILVITHIDELKDAFPTRIEVEKTAEGSTLRVV
jgi:DNA repair protein SbcC/Rad50